jgi:hypothetical protein
MRRSLREMRPSMWVSSPGWRPNLTRLLRSKRSSRIFCFDFVSSMEICRAHCSGVHAGLGVEGEPRLHRAQREIGDGADVVVALGRQADHEVQLDVVPAALVGLARHAEQLLVGDPLVDERPQPGRGRLGGKRQASAADVGDHVCQLDGERVQPQARQRDADPLGRGPLDDMLDHLADVGVVTRRQADERDLLVAGRR